MGGYKYTTTWSSYINISTSHKFDQALSWNRPLEKIETKFRVKEQLWKQARKPRSFASSKLRLTDLLTGVECRATGVAKKVKK